MTFSVSIFYIVKKEILQFIPENKMSDLAKDIFPKMLKTNRKLYGYHTSEFAKDIGTPNRYREVNK